MLAARWNHQLVAGEGELMQGWMGVVVQSRLLGPLPSRVISGMHAPWCVHGIQPLLRRWHPTAQVKLRTSLALLSLKHACKACSQLKACIQPCAMRAPYTSSPAPRARALHIQSCTMRAPYTAANPNFAAMTPRSLLPGPAVLHGN